MASHEEKTMNAALRLARKGLTRVEPNPAVGCIIEKDGRILGKGWHRAFGGPHAEINALADCRRRGADPRGATLYVTLEPCCHQGKTGPCTEAVIQAGIGRVVIAVIDPADHARGQGVQRLKAAGLDVTVGVCEAEARRLNAPFFHFATTARPWVILKWAQSIDGALAGPERWISGPASRRDVQALRRQTQAILVGINTVIADDPLLTPRPARGRTPLRIVLDNRFRIPPDCRLVATADRHPLLVVTAGHMLESQPDKRKRLEAQGVECLAGDLDDLCRILGGRGVQQLLVEGGVRVLTRFLRERRAHECRIYMAPLLLGAAGQAVLHPALEEVTAALHQVTVKMFDNDVRIRGYLEGV